MAKKQRRPRTTGMAPLVWPQHRRTLSDRFRGPDAPVVCHALQLLRAIAQAGHDEEELVSITEVEDTFNSFSQAIASCIPTEHHAAMLEAVERSSRKTLAST